MSPQQTAYEENLHKAQLDILNEMMDREIFTDPLYAVMLDPVDKSFDK